MTSKLSGKRKEKRDNAIRTFEYEHPQFTQADIARAFSPLVGHRKEHPDLVAAAREYLTRNGKPFVIENVPGAPLENYIILEGTMFGLEVKKIRHFECHGFEIILLPAKPDNTRGWIKSGRLVGMMQHSAYPKERVNRHELAVAYDMEWVTNRNELRQAIPPAYTEYIGKYLMAEVMRSLPPIQS